MWRNVHARQRTVTAPAQRCSSRSTRRSRATTPRWSAVDADALPPIRLLSRLRRSAATVASETRDANDERDMDDDDDDDDTLRLLELCSMRAVSSIRCTSSLSCPRHLRRRHRPYRCSSEWPPCSRTVAVSPCSDDPHWWHTAKPTRLQSASSSSRRPLDCNPSAYASCLAAPRSVTPAALQSATALVQTVPNDPKPVPRSIPGQSGRHGRQHMSRPSQVLYCKHLRVHIGLWRRRTTCRP